MVYGDGLENRCSRKGTVGSNPTPSAILKLRARQRLEIALPVGRCGCTEYILLIYLLWKKTYPHL